MHLFPLGEGVVGCSTLSRKSSFGFARASFFFFIERRYLTQFISNPLKHPFFALMNETLSTPMCRAGSHFLERDISLRLLILGSGPSPSNDKKSN